MVTTRSVPVESDAQAGAQGQLHLERVQREQLAAQNSSAAAEAKVQLEHEQLAAQNVVQNRAAAAFHPTPAFKNSIVSMCYSVGLRQ